MSNDNNMIESNDDKGLTHGLQEILRYISENTPTDGVGVSDLRRKVRCKFNLSRPHAQFALRFAISHGYVFFSKRAAKYYKPPTIEDKLEVEE